MSTQLPYATKALTERELAWQRMWGSRPMWCSGYVLARLVAAYPYADDPWAVWEAMTVAERTRFLAGTYA